MSRKSPANSKKTWSPDSPLKPDWNKVLEKGGSGDAIAEKLERANNPIFSRGEGAKHPRNPAHHGTFSRQKKG